MERPEHTPQEHDSGVGLMSVSEREHEREHERQNRIISVQSVQRRRAAQAQVQRRKLSK